MNKRTALLVAIVLLLGACSDGGDGGAAAEPSPSTSFPFATVLLDNGDESTLVTVEVAETPEQQEIGLSDKTSLPEDEGMVFVFFEEQEEGVSTEGASIPLSIAYFDARGTIVDIVDANACSDDPCPVEDPYMGALLVNQGAFEGWDVSEGDHVQLTR